MKKLRGQSALLAVVVATLCVAPLTSNRDTASATVPSLVAHGSARQVYATGLTPGDTVKLVDDHGHTTASEHVNTLGAVLFRDVEPGTGYTLADTDTSQVSEAVSVHSEAAAPWDPDIYSQPIAADGYQYLTTRDGTQLALYVHPPLAGGNGPFPTVIEYAGYGYADPAGPQSGLAKLANAMGFAVVDVNMRGTGCSGGAFDFFEPLQNLDAYDVIETISAQPWVLHNQVGMFGISYGGISQLFAAQLNPPHLAAIAPLSVIDATASTLYPGGILNNGFALSWAQGRVDDAQPATATTGEKWAYKRIQNGDTVCEANQALHPEAIDLIAKVRANKYYDPAVADPLDPVTFVHKIHMPVFLACQFQDEQTGGHCPELVRHFTGTSNKWFTFTNGSHIDALDPDTLNQLFDFLELFVAERPPGADDGILRLGAPIIYQTAMGVASSNSITLPTDPIRSETTYAGALAAFQRLPMVQVRFETGAGADPGGNFLAGNPYPTFSAGFDDLPVPGTQPRTWFLDSDGSLTDDPPLGGTADTYTSDANAVPANDYTGNTGSGGLWANAAKWSWNWQANPAGSAVSYVTAPLAQDTTVIGTGAVHLWVRSSTPDVDLQATISEVRPDGIESFVQNGWIRASERKLSTDSDNVFKRPSTADDPIPTFTQADAEPMPADEFVPVTIPLYYQGHAYRADSRIRVVISAPNGSQPVWAFTETEPTGGTAQVAIAHAPWMPSSLTLPTVSGVHVPAGLPVCPSLRNEPCRPYTELVNATDPLSPPTTTTTTTVPDTTIPDTTIPDTTIPDTTIPDTTTGPETTTTTAPSTTSPSAPTTVTVGPTTSMPTTSMPRPATVPSPSTTSPASTGSTANGPSTTTGVAIGGMGGTNPQPPASVTPSTQLPATGLDVGALAGAGLLLAVIGVVLDAATRSRRRAN